MRRAALLLLIAGCDAADQAETPPPLPRKLAPQRPPAPPPPEAVAEAEAAAAALRAYYRHIAERDFRAAWRMREERPGASFERFAQSFADYGDYRATVGVPSLPVEAEGQVWVSVPVQLYGRRRDGSPLGSVGRVAMKRRGSGGPWRLAE